MHGIVPGHLPGASGAGHKSTGKEARFNVNGELGIDRNHIHAA